MQELNSAPHRIQPPKILTFPRGNAKENANFRTLTGFGREEKARISGRNRSNTSWLRYTDPGGAGCSRRRSAPAMTPPAPGPSLPPMASMSIAAAYASARSSKAPRRRRPSRRAAALAPAGSVPRIDAAAAATDISWSAPAGPSEAKLLSFGGGGARRWKRERRPCPEMANTVYGRERGSSAILELVGSKEFSASVDLKKRRSREFCMCSSNSPMMLQQLAFYVSYFFAL